MAAILEDGGICSIPTSLDGLETSDQACGRQLATSDQACGRQLATSDQACGRQLATSDQACGGQLATSDQAYSLPPTSPRGLHGPWAKARDRLIRLFAESDRPDLRRRADKLASCCSTPWLAVAEDNTPRLCLVSCRDRLCPRCAHYRGRRVVGQLSEIVRGFNAPRFLTLTIRSRSEPLADTLDRLARAFRRLRRTPQWASHVVGGVYAIEVTYNPRTAQWHPHLHLIFDGFYWPQREISALWESITGDSPIVDIRAVPDRGAAAAYIAAYISKPYASDAWSDSALIEYADAVRGRRMYHTFGAAHAAAKALSPSPLPPPPPLKAVVPLPKIVRLAEAGHAAAMYILGYLESRGGWWAAAINARRDRWQGQLPEPDEAATAHAVACILALAEPYADAPAPTPHRRTRLEQPRLFDPTAPPPIAQRVA